MAVSIVQQGSATGASMGVSGDDLVLGAAPANGSVIFLKIENNDGVTGPVVTQTGVVWTSWNYFRGDGAHDNTWFGYGIVGAGASATIHIAWETSGGTNWTAKAVEVGGLAASPDGTPPTPTNVASATPSVSMSQAYAGSDGDFAIAFCGHTDNTAPTATPSGWTALSRPGGAPTAQVESAWNMFVGAGTRTAQWTFAASKNALMQIALWPIAPPPADNSTKPGVAGEFDPQLIATGWF